MSTTLPRPKFLTPPANDSGNLAATAEFVALVRAAVVAEAAVRSVADALLLSIEAAAATYQPALGFAPYNATNPAGYRTLAEVNAAVHAEADARDAADGLLAPRTALTAEITRATAAEALLLPIASYIPGVASITVGFSGNVNMPPGAQFVSQGDAVGRKHPTTGVTVPTWVGTAAGGLMVYYDQYGRNNNYLSTAHGMAYVAGVKSFDNTGVMIGYASYAQSTIGTSGAVWANYSHGARYGTGSVLGHEIDVCNVSTYVAAKPYQMGLAGLTACSWLGAGGETAQQTGAIPVVDTSCAIGMLANGTATNPTFFRKGIVFGANAISGTDGATGTGIAMQMAKGHEIQWIYDTAEGRGGFIRSTATGSGVGLLLNTASMSIVSENGETVLFSALKATGAVNGIQTVSSATGVGVAIQPVGSDANIPLVLQPTGLGWLAGNIRDGGVTGGIGRGNKAVDWQLSRTNAAHVAAGAYSTIIGGISNQITSAGNWAAVLGGQGNNAGGQASIVCGTFASDRAATNKFVFGWGSAAGNAQHGRNGLRGGTIDATPKRLTSDGAAVSAVNSIPLPVSGSYSINGRITGRDSSGNTAFWLVEAGIKTAGSVGSTAMLGTSSVTKLACSEAAATWATTLPILAADTTNGALSVTVTGAAATTISWAADLATLEIS